MSYIQLHNNIANILSNEHIKNKELEPTILYSNIKNEYIELLNKHNILSIPVISEKIKDYLFCDQNKFIASVEQLRIIDESHISIKTNNIYYNYLLYRSINSGYNIHFL
jgi:hypothetical protein